MRKIAKKVSVCMLLFCFAFAGAVKAEEPIKIQKVIIKNNKAISDTTIMSKIKTRPGDLFIQDILNDDLKRLYALGYFTDVSIDIDEAEGGVNVTILVDEKPVVQDIVIKGNRKLSSRKLIKAMQTKSGEMLNYSKLSQDISDLESLYKQNGFQQVDIKYNIETDQQTNTSIVYLDIVEQERVRIKQINVDGNEAVTEKVIRNMMATRAAWFFNRGYFNEEVFASDLEKIKYYYQSLGYLDAMVTADFDYEKESGQMFINLHITEGAFYTAGDITIEGELVLPKEDVLKQVHMKKGDPFISTALRQDMENMKELYYEQGYMNVEIDLKRNLDPATHRIDLTYKITANEVVYVGKINVKGNTKTKDIVIRRELRTYPGERFDGSKIRRSKERLYNLGFFEDVYFGTERTDDPSVRDLTVSVKETKTGEFSFGGGYSSIDEFMGFAQITQKNFDFANFPNFTGDGQNLSVKASIGSVRQDYDVSWTEPWIFDYPLSFGFDAYHRTHSRRSSVGYGYEEERGGGALRFRKEFTEEISGDLTYRIEKVTISDLSDEATQDEKDEEGTNWISSLILGATYDTRDNIYVPKRGVLVRGMIENAGGFLGFDKHFVKGYITTSYYHTFLDKLVLELKGRTGIAEAYGDSDEVPIYERFFAGGANTIRGYKERKVGPRDPGSNDPIGGEAMLIGNAEVTFPVFEKLIKGAVFYDVGNVWRRTSDFFSLEGDFKQGVGAGVRVKTPIGPLKLDAGYPLSENHDDEKQIEWYFSVSHGF